MDPASILKIITNSTWIVTQLLGENSLQFGRSTYSLVVSESVKPGPLLQLTVKVRTKDVRLHFQILIGNEKNLFYLHPSSGLLSLVSPLDYESQKKHDLIVEASFHEDKNKANVIIDVLDSNDNVPKFERERYETQITEEDDRHLPKPIMKVTASDGDIGRYGTLTYSLSKENSVRGTFQRFDINQTSGEIYLLKPLDRDPPYGRSQWQFDVIASDGELESLTTVVVNVKDVNDNGPFFPEEVVEAFVSENRPESTLVITVRALDNDDPTESWNGKVVYSLEKNVIDEDSGRPIFSIDSETGRVETALCCLDREKTESYAIQVVATDGGGLKGTGTVIVNVSDENDVPPQFSRNEWHLDINEEIPPMKVLASLNVIDPDVINDFQYRIVSGSGRGWDMFFLSSGNKTGSNLHSKVKLDYENPNHRKGFRFQVQVSDIGSKGWEDKYHIDSAWVNLRVMDINDNNPYFLKNAHYKKVPEDIPVGTPIISIKAFDADGGGVQKLGYVVDKNSNPDRIFGADSNGMIRLHKPLDRERSQSHRLVILAMDQGNPVKTATATLVIDVVDINDNPPYFTCPTLVKINEGSPPKVIANLTLDDPDDWKKGHGPPFSLSLDPKAPSYIKKAVKVDFDKDANEGKGFGIIRTVSSLDREERRHLMLPILVSDSGVPKQAATLTFTIALQDVNDNKMRSATKYVVAHIVQPATPLNSALSHDLKTKVPLGRIFVLDPDDWDYEDKKFTWKNPNSFFILNESDGSVFMEPWIPPGTYNLEFLVSDFNLGQSNVPANVTVEVKSLTSSDLSSSIPVDLEGNAKFLLRDSKGNHHSIIKSLIEKINAWMEPLKLQEESGNHESGNDKRNEAFFVSLQNVQSSQNDQNVARKNDRFADVSKSRLWITSFSSVNLEHVLLHKKREIEDHLGLHISSIGSEKCEEIVDCASGCWVKTEIGDGYALVDANSSSTVGPDLFLASGCGCHPPKTVVPVEDPYLPRPVIKETDEEICGGNICLNGGRCIPHMGSFRCICPHDTIGPHCKFPVRYFYGDSGDDQDNEDAFARDGSGRLFDEVSEGGSSWAWLKSLPSCAEVQITLDILTHRKDGVLLFSGTPHSQYSFPSNLKSFQKGKKKEKTSSYRNKREMRKGDKESYENLRGTESDIKESSLNFLVYSYGIKNKSFGHFETQTDKTFLNEPFHFEKENFKDKTKFRKDKLKRGREFLSKHRIRHKNNNVIRKLSTNKKVNIFDEQNETLRLNNNSQLQDFNMKSQDFSNEIYFKTKKNNEGRFYSRFLSPTEKQNLFVRKLTQNAQKRAKEHNWFQTTKERIKKLRQKKSLSQKPTNGKQDFILLELKSGKPHLLLNLGGGNIALSLSSSFSLANMEWHRIDIIWRDQLVEMIVDLCSGGSSDGLNHPSSNSASSTISSSPPDAFNCRIAAPLPKGGSMFNFRGPLQVGGMASVSSGYWSSTQRSLKSLRGCIGNLRINGEVQDLGYGILSSRSIPGCLSMNCRDIRKRCSDRGTCVGSPGNEWCECLPGWAGDSCSDETVPTTLDKESFITLALSFTPVSLYTTLQLRVRTRSENGELISLSSPHGKDRFDLVLEGGILCLTLRLHPETPSVLCLSKVKVNDGKWHRVKALRVGSATILSCDDGDNDRYNSSLLLDGRPLLQLSRQDGLHLGGSPEYLSGRVVRVHKDFSKGCIDDVRLQGRNLPLPPGVNGTKWGQVTTFRNVKKKCIPEGVCLNVSCSFPLSCVDNWQLYHCGCEKGYSLSFDGKSCDDINECSWSPCLHNGVCKNNVPGYSCSCPSGFSGEHCHVREGTRPSVSLPLALILSLAISGVLLILVFVLCFFYQRRKRRKMNEISNDVQSTDFDFQYQSPTTRGTELSTFRCKHNHPSPSVVHEPFIKLNGLQQKLGYAGIKGVDLHKAKNSTQTSENFCKKCDELDVENLSRDRHKKSVTNKFRKGEKESPNLEVINTYKET